MVQSAARRVLYCISGAWTDAWYDNPVAWWQWCCAFLGWDSAEWQAFYARWRPANEATRRELMAATGLYFFDWARVPEGSIRGSVRDAAAVMADDLASLPADADVTLLGHSKGGSVIKHLLASAATSVQAGQPPWPGARPARAIFVDAPLDWLREIASRWMRLGVERCRLSQGTCDTPLITVNNWLDPSGGRLRGARNYQTFIWQDYLNPYPPHGLKGFLAERVLRESGALSALAAPRRSEQPAREGHPFLY